MGSYAVPLPRGLRVFDILPPDLLENLLLHPAVALTSHDLIALSAAASSVTPPIASILSAVPSVAVALVHAHPNAAPFFSASTHQPHDELHHPQHRHKDHPQPVAPLSVPSVPPPHTPLTFLRFLELLEPAVAPHSQTVIFSSGRNDSGQSVRHMPDDTNTLSTTIPPPPPSLDFATSPTPSVILVAAGAHHSACLTARAALLVAGANNVAQLGLTDRRARPAWTPVPGLPRIASVTCGAAHTVLITENARVLAAGANDAGQLGLGDTAIRAIFTPVKFHLDVLMVSAGTAHTVALLSDGSVFAAGNNAEGQLGGPFAGSENRFNQVCCYGRHVVRIACGAHTTMLLTADNMVLVTGKRRCGLSVIGGLGTARVTHLSVGERFAIVATDEGHAAISVHRKRFVVTEELLPLQVRSVTAGISHYALVTDDGSAYAAGANAFGQVAAGEMGLTIAGSQLGRIVRPHRVPLSPVSIPEGYRVLQIAAGAFHTLYLLARRTDPSHPDHNFGD